MRHIERTDKVQICLHIRQAFARHLRKLPKRDIAAQTALEIARVETRVIDEPARYPGIGDHHASESSKYDALGCGARMKNREPVAEVLYDQLQHDRDGGRHQEDADNE